MLASIPTFDYFIKHLVRCLNCQRLLIQNWGKWLWKTLRQLLAFSLFISDSMGLCSRASPCVPVMPDFNPIVSSENSSGWSRPKLSHNNIRTGSTKEISNCNLFDQFLIFSSYWICLIIPLITKGERCCAFILINIGCIQFYNYLNINISMLG